MSAFSDELEVMIINHFLSTTASTAGSPQALGYGQTAAPLYLGLFTNPGPGETGNANEVAWTNYGRKPIQFAATTGSTGITQNSALVEFVPNGGGTAVTVTHAAVYTAITGGTMMLHGELVSPKTVDANDVLSFAANALVLTVS
jgi:FtsH-binding integral membrane protein